MRPIIITLLCSTAIFLLPACKKQQNATSTKTLTINLKTGEDYSLDLGTVGDEEGGAITRQASHYTVSQINRQIPTGRLSYVYQPLAGYTGTDEANITVSRGSDGASPNTNVQQFHLIFTVSN